jgi:hypothetical protein
MRRLPSRACGAGGERGTQARLLQLPAPVPLLRARRALSFLRACPHRQSKDEVAVALAQEIAPLPAEQRAEFVDQLGSGFFPPRVVAGVKERLGAR